MYNVVLVSSVQQSDALCVCIYMYIYVYICVCVCVYIYIYLYGFPGDSDDKEPACNEGDLGSVPGSARSSGEGSGYSLQCSCLENSMDRGAWRAASPLGRKESDTTEQLTFALFFMYIYIFQIIFHYRLLQDIEYIVPCAIQ